MFYSQVILARKGPLGKIWLAAHFEKKLSKSQIFTTDIVNAVQTLLDPASSLALRVSGHLMLGLVRIYSKKVKYLMIDCTDAMWKMQFAFQPGKVDIDTQQSINIDDNRFYGNVSMDLEYPVLDNVAFVSSLLPLTPNLSSKDPLSKDVSEVREIVNSQNTSIEFIRAGERVSISGTRPSLSFERKISISSKFEDDIPIFEEEVKINDSFHFDKSLVFPTENLQRVAPTFSSHPLEFLSEGIQQDNHNFENKAKKRKTANQIELRDTIIKQNLDNVREILRKRSVQFASSDLQYLRLEDATFNCSQYCDDLKDLAFFATNALPYPFPEKTKDFNLVQVSHIEKARKRKSGESETFEAIEYAVSSERAISFLDFQAPYDPLRISSVPNDGTAFEVLSLFNSVSDVRTAYFPQKTPPFARQLESESPKKNLLLMIQSKRKTHFGELTRQLNRKNASRFFLELLQLRTKNLIRISQEKPYSDIEILSLS